MGHVATPRLLGASGCQFDSGEDRTINMVPPVRSPRSTAVCEDLSPFVCELRKRSKIVPKVTRGNSRPGTSALPRNTAVSDIQQQPRAVSWGRVEYMSDPPRGLLRLWPFLGHVATPRLLGASGCQFDSGEDRTINNKQERRGHCAGNVTAGNVHRQQSSATTSMARAPPICHRRPAGQRRAAD